MFLRTKFVRDLGDGGQLDILFDNFWQGGDTE